MAKQNATTSFITIYDESKKYCIYLHRNKINGKCYVGQTHQDPERRWRHGKGYIKNELFYADIEFYGWDKGFDHIILEDNLTEQEVDKREQYWISFYNAYENGYNRNEGGNCPHHYSEEAIENFKKIRQEFWDSEEGKKTKQKVSQSLKDFYKTEEGIALRERLSKQKMGINNPHYGKKHTEENIQKMRDCKKGELNPNYNKKGIKNHLSKPVYCIEDNVFYGSGQEAKEKTGIDPSSISKCCRGLQNVAGKKHWRYATEDEILIMKGELNE